MRIQQHLSLAAALFTFALLGSNLAQAESKATDPATRAATDKNLQVAVATASKAWKDAFNAGDAAAAAALYEEDAVMVVKPFGTYKGRKAIQAFWTDIISKGFDDVVYKNTVTTLLDDKSARIASDWKMNNAHGVITNELWVIQPDGRALLREDHFEIAQ
ncbi:SgcJ/EcaC family oxidoreductase [Pleionea sp. CnH1-48]|uniref:SgcJ/EcaC family oxidoreductase n=1 Tax=Pleionea sp. CnH1-48 TaxID=2954494 RepID=UPI0020972C26|nr:SgcJ/EcaC family oxidoreductase [Pleionea sp. CnH1-48]MCO7222697.1 SgcJ/EcaC family oxidoreductase [Pleionea sp. CnH1-48]